MTRDPKVMSPEMSRALAFVVSTSSSITGDGRPVWQELVVAIRTLAASRVQVPNVDGRIRAEIATRPEMAALIRGLPTPPDQVERHREVLATLGL